MVDEKGEKCYVRAQGILGDATILTVDSTSKDYSALFEAVGLMVKHKDDFGAESDFQDVAVSAFRRLMIPYFTQIGMGVPKLTYVWANPLKASMEFSGRKIIPGREDCLDGYKPCVDFEVKGTKKAGVKFIADGYLEREGMYSELNVLEELVKRKYAGGRGVENPRIREDEEKARIHVNSVNFIPRVLDSFKHFYEKIGMPRLEEMAELSGAIGGLEGNKTAVKVLKDEYEKILGILES